MTVRKIASLSLFVALLAALSVAKAQDYDSAAEQELFKAVNAERARAGLPSVAWDDNLQRAAREHSRLMADAHQLSHQFSGEPTLPKRLAATGLRFNNDAENAAYDNTVEGAHTGFMHSPPHRANILNGKYNAAGIGVVRKGDLLWVTEDFAHKLESYSEQDARNAVVAAFERLRTAANLPRAGLVNVKGLSDMACNMAKNERLDTASPLGVPNARSAVVFNETEPDKLPSSAQKEARNTGIRSFATGVCFAKGEKYPSGAYWVVMVFF